MKIKLMTFSKILKIFTHFLLVLFFCNPVNAEPKANKLWFPDFIEAKIVSEALNANGITMQIWEISSEKPSSYVLDYYQGLWSQEPGFLHYKARQWNVNGYIEGRWFVSLQLLDKQLDSFGFLTISAYPHKTPNMQTKHLIILPPDTKLLTNIYTEDGPHKSRTVTFTNQYSLDSNVNFFRQHYKNRNWTEDDVPSTISSTKTLLFRNGPDNATISINNLGKNVGGVAVLVEH